MKRLLLLLSIALAIPTVKGVNDDNSIFEPDVFNQVTDDGVRYTVLNGTIYSVFRELTWLGAEMDSLVIRSPHLAYDDNDFAVIREICRKGRLAVLNLDDAFIVRHILPASAFHKGNAAISATGEQAGQISVRRVMLPEGLVEICDGAFRDCPNLELVDLPSTLKRIGANAFAGCKKLRLSEIQLPEGLEIIDDGAFYGCNTPGGVLRIPSTVRYIGDHAFANTGADEVVLPRGECEVCGSAFAECNFKSLILRDENLIFTGTGHFEHNTELSEVEASGSGVGESMFFFCKQLEKVVVAEGTATIGRNAFAGCNAMKSIAFPSTLTYLGSGSLSGCTNLKEIYISATMPPICEATDDDGLSVFGQGDEQVAVDTPVYVPSCALESYRNAPGWERFVNYIPTEQFPSGIEDTPVSGISGAENYYDLSGKKVGVPQSGQIYITDRRKIVLIP